MVWRRCCWRRPGRRDVALLAKQPAPLPWLSVVCVNSDVCRQDAEAKATEGRRAFEAGRCAVGAGRPSGAAVHALHPTGFQGCSHFSLLTSPTLWHPKWLKLGEDSRQGPPLLR